MSNEKFFKELKKKLASEETPWRASLEILQEAKDNYFLGYTPGPDEPSLEEQEALAKANYQALLKEKIEEVTFPPSFDLRNISGRNFISSVKSQGSCGSCVAFGTAAGLEGTVRMKTNTAVNDSGGNKLLDLSEAQLFYCGAAQEGRNCKNGWWPSIPSLDHRY